MEFFCGADRRTQIVFFVGLVFCFCYDSTYAYDPLDPNGNITIKWDVMSWTDDGYVAAVTISNFQMYRHIEDPGWKLGWVWSQKEVIWSALGAQATEQGDCSQFKGNIPHCCKKNPTVVDLLPGAPYNQQVASCCKGGVISSLVQDSANAASSFQLTVGQAGTSNTTVKLPQNFTLATPGPGYTCGAAFKVPPTKFLSADKRRVTQALMTWSVTCTYSQFLASSAPTCCVSLSSFYNSTIVNCPACSCGCPNKTQPNCVDANSPHLSLPGSSSSTPAVQCTGHMCPVRVHWHVQQNYKEYWRVKLTITNFNYMRNYTQWNAVVQHPNMGNITQIFSFNYQPLNSYGSINDTAMLWGFQLFNDLLMQDGPGGNVQSEILFKKDKTMFTLEKGWAFPRRVYFNGDNCVMPPPDQYPYLPGGSHGTSVYVLNLVAGMATCMILFFLRA